MYFILRAHFNLDYPHFKLSIATVTISQHTEQHTPKRGVRAGVRGEERKKDNNAKKWYKNIQTQICYIFEKGNMIIQEVHVGIKWCLKNSLFLQLK